MIAVMTAMKFEYRAMTDLLQEPAAVHLHKHKCTIGLLHGQDVLVAQSGMGKTAAAIAAAQILENYPIECMISMGIAGGLRESEQVLDLVISRRLTYHDWDQESCGGTRGFAQNPYVFASDPALSRMAKEAAVSVWKDRSLEGDMVSGDAFVSGEQAVSMIREKFPTALACDMESAALAHACSEYEIPFLSIRVLSDLVWKEANLKDCQEFAEMAARRCAAFAECLTGKIAEEKKDAPVK